MFVLWPVFPGFSSYLRHSSPFLETCIEVQISSPQSSSLFLLHFSFSLIEMIFSLDFRYERDKKCGWCKCWNWLDNLTSNLKISYGHLQIRNWNISEKSRNPMTFWVFIHHFKSINDICYLFLWNVIEICPFIYLHRDHHIYGCSRLLPDLLLKSLYSLFNWWKNCRKENNLKLYYECAMCLNSLECLISCNKLYFHLSPICSIYYLYFWPPFLETIFFPLSTQVLLIL